jgi:hypothetical protein
MKENNLTLKEYEEYLDNSYLWARINGLVVRDDALVELDIEALKSFAI